MIESCIVSALTRLANHRDIYLGRLCLLLVVLIAHSTLTITRNTIRDGHKTILEAGNMFASDASITVNHN